MCCVVLQSTASLSRRIQLRGWSAVVGAEGRFEIGRRRTSVEIGERVSERAYRLARRGVLCSDYTQHRGVS